jgi:hypothetical protein
VEDWKGVGSQSGRVHKVYISVGLEFPVRQMYNVGSAENRRSAH